MAGADKTVRHWVVDVTMVVAAVGSEPIASAAAMCVAAGAGAGGVGSDGVEPTFVVAPSAVRRATGDAGNAFDEAVAHLHLHLRQRWRVGGRVVVVVASR